MLMADRPTADFGFKRDVEAQFADALRWQRQQPHARWLLVEGEALPTCVDKARAQDMDVANGRRWWLLQAEAATACR